MAVTVTTAALAFPGRPIVMTLSTSLGNFIRVYCTAAPADSSTAKLFGEVAAPFLHLGAVKSGEKITLAFDKPGAYSLLFHEIQRGVTGFGGGFDGDPDGFTEEVIVASVATRTVYLCQRCTADVVIGSDRGALTVWVSGSSIVATTFSEHGEATPSFVGSTDRMKIAASSSAVVSALALLAGTTTLALGSFATQLDNVITKFNAHRSQSGVHSVNDSNNSIASSFKAAETDDALKRTLGEVLSKIRRHITNDSTGSGPGSAATEPVGSPPGLYHSVVSWASVPVLSGASGRLQQGIAIADAWYAYETHRVNASSHSNPDTTNTCTALSPLLEFYRQVLIVLKSQSPTAPTTDNPGAVALVSGAGFTKS